MCTRQLYSASFFSVHHGECVSRVFLRGALWSATLNTQPSPLLGHLKPVLCCSTRLNWTL